MACRTDSVIDLETTFHVHFCGDEPECRRRLSGKTRSNMLGLRAIAVDEIPVADAIALRRDLDVVGRVEIQDRLRRAQPCKSAAAR
jgi:hypothetical protein